MRNLLIVGALTLVVGLSAFLSMANAAEPKHTIKEVMKIGMKDKLLNKVLDGKASDDEKKTLHGLFVDMGENKPPKGDEESWKTLNDTLIAAAQDVVDGKEGGIPALKKASNCAMCHKVHKP